MATVISFINNKGGCGKTAAVLEAAYHLGKRNKKVLVIDLDPQFDATKRLLKEPNQPVEATIATAFKKEIATDYKAVIHPIKDDWPNCFLIPGHMKMGTIIVDMLTTRQREFLLKKFLEPLQKVFDIILIDCPPAMNDVTTNALVASTHYFILLNLGYSSLRNHEVIKTLVHELIEEDLAPNLTYLGTILTGIQKGHASDVKIFMEDVAKLLPDYIEIPASSRVLKSEKQNLPYSALFPKENTTEGYRTLSKTIFKATNNIQA